MKEPEKSEPCPAVGADAPSVPEVERKSLQMEEVDQPVLPVKYETIELDIGSNSDDEGPSDPVHRLSAQKRDPYFSILDRYIADAHIAYREAKREAGRRREHEYSDLWEDRAERYRNVSVKIIEIVHKMQNGGKQNVVVEHRSSPERSSRAPRRPRPSDRQAHDPCASVARNV